MSEDRRHILEMLSSGKVTPDEAEKLLQALEDEAGHREKGAAESSEPPRGPAPKYLRVIVENDHAHHGDHGPARVNVRIPIQLLRAGVKLASLIPAPARSHINEALHENGIPIDVSQIKAENLDELIDQLTDFTVEADEHGSRVRVYCE